MPFGREYSARLKEQTQQAIAPHLGALENRLEDLRKSLADSFDQLAPRLEALRQMDFSFYERLIADAVAEAESGKEAQHHARMAGFTRFLRSIRRFETQKEILELLLDEAQRSSPRIVLFVVKDSGCAAWAVRGYSEETTARVSGALFPRAEMATLGLALENDSPIRIDDPSSHEDLRNLLGGDGLLAWHLFPMTVLERRAAILLAEERTGADFFPDSIQNALQIAELRLENISLKILQDIQETGEGAVEAEEEQPPPAQTQAESEVVPEAPSQPEPAFAEAVPPATAEVFPPESAENREEVEDVHIPVIEMPPSADAPIADLAAPPGTGGAEPALVLAVPVEKPAPIEPPAASAAAATSEERQHSEARRFARLLVSEIKLYNEQKVAEGRENHDLYDRLKRDIDRSREMYEARVPVAVSRKFDYFHDELVRILAEGSVERLGSDCPGPRVDG